MANVPKIHQLRTDLASYKQGNLEVLEFHSKLMGMLSELENYTKVPHCTCGKCECDIGTKIVKMIETRKWINFEGIK